MFYKSLILTLLTLESIYAAVLVRTEPLDQTLSASAWTDRWNQEILSGLWDHFNIAMPIDPAPDFSIQDLGFALQRKANTSYLQINSSSFSQFPSLLRKKILVAFFTSYQAVIPMLRAFVNTQTNDLGSEPLLELLGIDFKNWPNLVPAEKMLSEFSHRWAYKESKKAGPNCFHSAVASISKNWIEPRYMDPAEFACHLKQAFEVVVEPNAWGDLILIRNEDGLDQHAFTYLGKDEQNEGQSIVFTKNGYKSGVYLYSTQSSILELYKAYGSRVSFYRKIREITDPSKDPSSECYKTYVPWEKASSARVLKLGGPPDAVLATLLTNPKYLPRVSLP